MTTERTLQQVQLRAQKRDFGADVFIDKIACENRFVGKRIAGRRVLDHEGLGAV